MIYTHHIWKIPPSFPLSKSIIPMHMYSDFSHFRLIQHVIFGATNLQPYRRYTRDFCPAFMTRI